MRASFQKPPEEYSEMLTRRATPIFSSAGLPVCLLALATVSTVSAQDPDIYWICPEGGLFENPACWDTFSVPTSGDTAVFDLGETYTIFTNNDQATDFMDVLDDLSLDIYGVDDRISLYTLDIGYLSTTPEAAVRVLHGNLDTNWLFLGNSTTNSSTLQLTAGTYMDIGEGIFYDSAVVDIEIGADTVSPAVWVYGFYTFFGGTLVASHRDGTELTPLGSDFTLFSFYGTMNTPFDTVITDPPPGRSYIISGNYSGSSEIIATVDVAPTIPVPEVGSLDTLSDQAIAIEVGDLTDDLIDDIVVLLPAEGKSNGKMRIYVNDGTGGYSYFSDYEVGSDPVDLAIGDFDGDFINDVAVIDQSSSAVWVYLNPRIDPSDLDDPVISSTESEPTAIVTCNLGDDDDGVTQVASKTDLMITNKGGTKKATGYRSDDSGGIRQVAFVEVEDDPGPANSEDEERKDDDTNVGIGHGSSSGFTTGSGSYSLTIITTHRDGTMTLVSNTELASAPMAITHANLDGDGGLSNEVVVGTENGEIVIFNEIGNQLGHYSLGNSLSGISAGDIDNSNSGFDDLIASIDNDGDQEVVLLSNLGISGEIQLEEGGTFDAEVSENGLVTGRLFSDLSTSLIGLAAITNSTTEEDPEVLSGLFDRIPTPLCVAADFDGNSNIDGGDLGLLIAAWGPCSGCPADLNDDGVVDGGDLGLFLTLWGPCEL